MSWELMSYGELMSGGTNVLDSIEKMGESNIIFCTLTISSIAPMVVIVMKTSDGKS